jgi:hypothetical protein
VDGSCRQWGSVRSFASGRYQARYFYPDTRRMVPPESLGVLRRVLDRARGTE